MKYFILTLLFAGAIFQTIQAQQKINWTKWTWLIGDWEGEGSGQPGKGVGNFSFRPDLNKKILVRKAHSSFPATNDKPASVHDDLMIVYTDSAGNPDKAVYFDNESHSIHYTVSFGDNMITLLSDPSPGSPVFRLTYYLLTKMTINTKFEWSGDGEKFTTYIEGKSTRVR